MEKIISYIYKSLSVKKEELNLSGSGKTTLLNVIAQQNLNGFDTRGMIRINGQKVNRSTVRSLSAYIQQDDLFIGSLTAREQLMFYVCFRIIKWYSHFAGPHQSRNSISSQFRIKYVVQKSGKNIRMTCLLFVYCEMIDSLLKFS